MAADSNIPGLPAAGALAGTELVPISQSGVTKQTTTQAVANLAKVAFTGDSGFGGAIGMVPAPAAGLGALQYVLCANGSWIQVPTTSIRRNLIGTTDYNGVLYRTTRRDQKATIP